MGAMTNHAARVKEKRRKSGGFPHAAAHDSVLVIGLGNPLRGDDAAGRIVAARVKRQNHRFLRVAEALGEGADLLELWASSGKVIVVDAVDSGGKTGMIHRFDASQAALPVQFGGSSTHAIGLGEAVELARALNQLPSRLIVYGIEGRQFDMGSKPSAAVKRMVSRVVDRVVGEARKLLAAQASAFRV